MTPNPYQQYKATQVQTATTGDLILLLYDGAIRFLSRARLAIEEGRLDAASDDLVRGQNIVLELHTGLDYEQGGKLAQNLSALYVFMYQALLRANLKKDVQEIQTVIRMLDQVRGAWRAVVRGDGATGDRQGGMAAMGRAA